MCIHASLDWLLQSGDSHASSDYKRAPREDVISFKSLKEEVQACLKYGNATHRLVPFLREHTYINII